MKKFLVLFMMAVFLPAAVFADDANPGETAGSKDKTKAAEQQAKEAETEEYIVYDVYRHMETANNVYMGIGALSIAAGIGMSVNAGDNRLVLGAGLQNIAWGLVETGLAVYDKNWAEREKDPEKARKIFHENSGRNLIIDLSCITAGGLLLIFGDESIKGHGAGIMMQGALLALFDSANFFITDNPEDIRGWNAGWNITAGFYFP